jgi:hypothetical protein
MPRGYVAPEERLRAIETLLLWEGRVTRGRLLALFPVHETVASRDLLAYRQKYPRSLAIDTTNKAYDATAFLKPTLTEGMFAEYQQLIGVGCPGISDGHVPVESSRLDATQIDFRNFARLHTAIRAATCVRMEYRSMRNPEKHERFIRPHSFIQAGPRWHVRGFCREVNAFRDFNLGRINTIKVGVDESLPGIEEDHDWNTLVRLRLVSHRDLSAAQKQLVRDEYMAGTTALVFEIRKPMARYLVQSFRAAIDPDTETPPSFLLMVDDVDGLPLDALWKP